MAHRDPTWRYRLSSLGGLRCRRREHVGNRARMTLFRVGRWQVLRQRRRFGRYHSNLRKPTSRCGLLEARHFFFLSRFGLGRPIDVLDASPQVTLLPSLARICSALATALADNAAFTRATTFFVRAVSLSIHHLSWTARVSERSRVTPYAAPDFVSGESNSHSPVSRRHRTGSCPVCAWREPLLHGRPSDREPCPRRVRPDVQPLAADLMAGRAAVPAGTSAK
jgi:hypothetical protein